jgi:hypothetical protein
MKRARRIRKPIVMLVLAMGWAVASTSLHADSLTIANPGFEAFPLGQSTFSTHIGTGVVVQVLSGNPIPGWTLSGHGGTWHPDGSSYPGGAPEGVNVAWLEYESIHSTILSQVLGDVLTADTVYTLSVKVGRRLDYPLAPFRVQLLAGGELLNEGTLDIIPAGTFQTVAVTFAAPADHPQLGQALEIRLTADGANLQQVNFDDVKLDATPQ